MRSQAVPRRRPRPPRTTPKPGRRIPVRVLVDAEREAVAVEDRAERDDLARRINDEPEIGELVTGAVVVQQGRHEERVELQRGVRVITDSLNAAVTLEASHRSCAACASSMAMRSDTSLSMVARENSPGS